MLGRFCACVVLLSVVRFTVCQTLYSAIRGGESPELHALKTAVKQLMEELRVIKEILPKKHSCPPNWSSFGSSCYLVNPNPKSYKDAALSCIMQGYKLVEIETQQENSFLGGILKAGVYWTGGTDSLSENKWVWPMTGKSLTNFNAWEDARWYWTGGTDVLTEDEWVWPMTGTPLTLFDDWKEGEPNGYNGGEDCLEYRSQYTKKWNDRKCNATLKFICEKNAVY